MVQSALLTMMSRAVLKAAKPVVRDFGELDRLQVSRKGTANFVTSADLRTERILMEELGEARKKFGFMTEESGEIAGEDPDWRFVIDPIDGTTNFIHAIPYFCIAVAAEKRNDQGVFEAVSGVIYDPMHDDLFLAEKGQGASHNGRRIAVSNRTEELLLCTTSPRSFRESYDEVDAAFRRVTQLGATVRCSGSAALDLAYVAAGRYDGIWYHALQCWDMSAGLLMVREAGGLCSTIDDKQDGTVVGTSGGSMVASNGHIHKMLRSALVAPAK